MEDREARNTIKQHEQTMRKLAESIAETARKQHEASLLAQQKALKETLIEVQAKLYDRAAAYANLVLIAGYASIFAIWAGTRSQLPLRANVVIAVALGLSLCTFVSWEVYKAIYISIRFMKNRSLIFSPEKPEEYLQRVREYVKQEQQVSILYIPLWIIQLVLSIVLAFIAVTILFYNYFAIMVGWPAWPA